MLAFDLGKERKFDPMRHVEKVLGRIADGDVTIACWEPGQVSPNHLHPNATEIYFCVEGGGVMRTPDATLDITPGAFVVHPPGELHHSNGPRARSCSACATAETSRRARRTGRAIRTGAHDPRTLRSSPKRADHCRTSSTRGFFALPSSVALSLDRFGVAEARGGKARGVNAVRHQPRLHLIGRAAGAGIDEIKPRVPAASFPARGRSTGCRPAGSSRRWRGRSGCRCG